MMGVGVQDTRGRWNGGLSAAAAVLIYLFGLPTSASAQIRWRLL